jgi:hypothetical protein
MYYNPYKLLPGVESTNESIANINVRGGTNDQMLWDNIKCTILGTFGLISAYNPNVTNKVTVSKTEPALPIDGVSSTINMSTNDKIGLLFQEVAVSI